jgi:hypothetical protein
MTPIDETDEWTAPTGLLYLGRRRLTWIVAIYAALLVAVLAIPVLAMQPRGASSHLSQQEVQTAAPGRER